jgi:hypothetical protein
METPVADRPALARILAAVTAAGLLRVGRPTPTVLTVTKTTAATPATGSRRRTPTGPGTSLRRPYIETNRYPAKIS